jgi:Xaa-Pro aminopeptidase
MDECYEFRVFCRGAAEPASAWRKLSAIRAVKDPEELAAIRRAASITDEVLVVLGEGLSAGRFATEREVAEFLDQESRRCGAAGLSFEPIVAGPERSWAIHAVPAAGEGRVSGPGFTIVDFGVKVDGYCTDVTVTAVSGDLTPRQRTMLDHVVAAVGHAERVLARAAKDREDAAAVAEAMHAFYEKAGEHLPHAMGHGIGLDVHEDPVFRTGRRAVHMDVEPGMVIACEPALYDPEAGGVRLENDYLLTPTGIERLTNAGVVRI